MKRIDDLDVAGQVVLLRADLNVPLDGDVITDDGRVRASLPTIRALTSRGARVIICAHLGRPKGETYAARAAGGPSLRPVAARLSELLGQPVPLAEDVAGESAAAVVAGLGDGEVGLLENVRFEPAETSKIDAERTGLAARLAALATRYVGDGFGALHRKHASVYDVPALLPHAAGDLVIAEIAVLRQLTSDPPRPYVVVLGGAKPSDKLAVISNLLGRADRLIICGGMSYTFLAAQGYEVGKSLLEADEIPQVTEVLAEAGRRGSRSSCRWTWWPPTGSPRTRTTAWCRSASSRRTGRASTWARRPGPCSPRSSPTRRPCSGTARLACSSSRPSPPEPGPWPRRSAASAG